VRSSLLFPLLALIACAPAPDPIRTDGGTDTNTPFTPDPCKSALGMMTTLTVGEGQTFYRDIADNTELFWEKGPQGGHHIWVALRERGLRMRGTIITMDLYDVSDESNRKLVNHSRLIYDFDRDEGGFCARPGLRMQLDNAGGPTLAELLGHKIEVNATLNDPDGAVATAKKTVIVKGTLD
jgi:hypothetical protein